MTEPEYQRAYRELREQLTELLQASAEADLDRLAPATPDWRVRDIVGHLAGVCDDVANGRLDGVGTDDWTRAQVAQRRDWPTERLLADWREHASAIEPQLNGFPPVIVGQMIADTYTHEQDVRGALRAPGGRDSLALAIAFEWATDRFGHRLTANDEGTVVVESEVGTKALGSGTPSTTLRAHRFEVVRAMFGRRSRAQMQALEWDGPFEPDALLLTSTIFSHAASNVVE